VLDGDGVLDSDAFAEAGGAVAGLRSRSDVAHAVAVVTSKVTRKTTLQDRAE
jgi:hypothetical protein